MISRKHSFLAFVLAFSMTTVGCRNSERSLPLDDSSFVVTETLPEMTAAPSVTTVASVSTTAKMTFIHTTETVVTTVPTTTILTTTSTVPVTEPPFVADYLPSGVTLKFAPTVEVYRELTLGDLVTESNVQLQNADTVLDTETLGEHITEVVYLHDNQPITQKLQYQVLDTTKPFLLNSGSNVTHRLGKAFDINNYVGVADNCDDHPKISYTGNLDVNTVGTYPLTVTAADASGNSYVWNIKVNVKEASSSSGGSSTSTHIPFADFKAQYGSEDTALGIDVSRWQDAIDFNAVKAAGCEFVIMRIASQRDNEVSKDIRFDRFFADAKKAGLKVGVYIYSTAYNETMLHEATAFVNEALHGEKLDFPVVFDWEDFTNYQKYGISQHGLNRLFDLFVSDMRGYGYDGMLYSSKFYLQSFWLNPQKYHPVWLAHYTSQTDYEGSYAIWQRCAVGRIDGIAGDVDFDVFYKNRGLPF